MYGNGFKDGFRQFIDQINISFDSWTLGFLTGLFLFIGLAFIIGFSIIKIILYF